MSLFDSKKGQINNYIAVIIVLFVFGIMSLFAMTIYLGIIDGFTVAGFYIGDLLLAGEAFKGALLLYDWVIVLIMVAMIIGVGITSFRLNSSAMFFILSLILAPFLGFISYLFNHIFIQIANEPSLAIARLLFPNTILICTNLHWIALIAFVVGSIALYGKKPTAEIITPPLP